MSRNLLLIDAGHGGVNLQGVYTTPGKRSFFKGKKLTNGENFYEGVSNRRFASLLAKECEKLGIPYEFLHEPIRDTPLAERVLKANTLAKKYDKTLLISLHSDWIDNPSVRGFSVWTTVGETASDKVATAIHQEISKTMPMLKARKDLSDGDVDFENQFYILRFSNMPSVLCEYLFFSNAEDVECICNRLDLDVLYMKSLSTVIKNYFK
jgi:N-acetylmuramoyl-L-alanine amidase